MLSDNNDTSSELAAVKNQLFTLLVALIVVTGTLTVYLFRETSSAGKDIAQGLKLAALLNQNDANMNAFVGKLVAYGEKHPDFVPVLKKYGLTPGQGIPAGSPAVPAK